MSLLYLYEGNNVRIFWNRKKSIISNKQNANKGFCPSAVLKMYISWVCLLITIQLTGKNAEVEHTVHLCAKNLTTSNELLIISLRSAIISGNMCLAAPTAEIHPFHYFQKDDVCVPSLRPLTPTHPAFKLCLLHILSIKPYGTTVTNDALQETHATPMSCFSLCRNDFFLGRFHLGINLVSLEAK